MIRFLETPWVAFNWQTVFRRNTIRDEPWVSDFLIALASPRVYPMHVIVSPICSSAVSLQHFIGTLLVRLKMYPISLCCLHINLKYFIKKNGMDMKYFLILHYLCIIYAFGRQFCLMYFSKWLHALLSLFIYVFI